MALSASACSSNDPVSTDGAKPTTASGGLAYEADPGPGRVGDEVDTRLLGITGVTEPAVKLSRRTYRIPEPGGSTTVVIAPTRWNAADVAAAAAAAAPTVANCGALARADAEATDAALAGITVDDVSDLPLVDRQFAVSELLLPMLENSRAYVAASPCDLQQLAADVWAGIAPSSLDVVTEAMSPLDLTGTEPAEGDRPFDANLLAGLLQPVER